jgi:hypothetical protein
MSARGRRRPLFAALLAGALVCAGSGAVGSRVGVAGAGGSGSAAVGTSVSVAGPLRVVTAALPAGVRGLPYPPQTLVAAGGVPPYTWALVGGTLPRGMQLGADGDLSGRPLDAGNPLLTVQVQDAEIPPEVGLARLALLVTPPGVSVVAAAVAGAVGGAAAVRIGGSGPGLRTVGAQASGGSGGVSLAAFSGDPAPLLPAFAEGGLYLDVALAAGSNFTRLQLTLCGTAAAGRLAWWDAAAGRWLPVSQQWLDSAAGCRVAVVTATTSPSLADLGGTYLALGVPLPGAGLLTTGPTPAAPGALQAVGAGGGLLGTPDGAFQLSIAPGVLPAGGVLGVSETPPPTPVPPGLRADGPAFVLTGPALPVPLPASIAFGSGPGGPPAAWVSAYAAEPGGGWTAVPTAASSATGTAQVLITGPETLVLLVSVRTFPDLPPAAWDADAIGRLVAAGVLAGYPDGSMRPDAPVTRAEFAKMLDLAVGLPPAAGGGTAFADVPAGSWFRTWVAAAAQAGLVQGRPDHRFAPGDALSRQEMAVLVARALALAPGASMPPFADRGAVSGWAAPQVGALVAAGYLRGFPDGTFRPGAPATRAEAATLLSFVLLHRAGAFASGPDG